MRSLLPCLALALLASVVASSPAHAVRVTNLTAIHHDGQTFLTWGVRPGRMWTFRVYASASPIYFLGDFWYATQVATIRDSSWIDRRLYALTGVPRGYCVDSLATPLDSTQALCVLTPPAAAQTYYCVTADSAGMGQDCSFQIGGNTLLGAVQEAPDLPRPVYQRTLTIPPRQAEIYTLWTSETGTSLFPAMANSPQHAYDCAIVRGGDGPADPLLVRPHHRGGSFLDVLGGTAYPREWLLALDDPWLNWDGNTYWYGYHENYDMNSAFNTPPTSGVVRDYTLKRVIFTLEWARRTFPIDTARVCAMGYSMGGIGSLLLGLSRPDLVAAVGTVVGKFDFGFLQEPVPQSAFNPDQPLRLALNRMWGTVPADLPTSEGLTIYQRTNDGVIARLLESTWVPPIVAFNGKNDETVGWAEKIPFYHSMNEHRHGGYFFWDTRGHIGGPIAWGQLQDMRYLYRFRTNRSFPAISNCSADFDPGNGQAWRGDSVGTINGFVEWDTTLVDLPDRWEVTLHLRDLPTTYRTLAAPESVTLDVTPRRLQSFRVRSGSLYQFTAQRLSDGAVVRQEIDQADSLGLVTLHWLKVHRSGTRLVMTEVALTDGVETGAPGSDGPYIALSRNPATGPVALDVTWPRRGDARVDLLDVSGRRVKSLHRGEVLGPTHFEFDGRALPGGIYFVTARQGEAKTTRRLIILH